MPRGKKRSTTGQQDAPKKRGRPRKSEIPAGKHTITRPITDTCGIALSLRAEDTPPQEGGTVHVRTEKGEEFDLRISKVQPKKHGGWCVWCWLRKEAKDGKRWRDCRLQQATVSY
jgi:hypothetical protein